MISFLFFLYISVPLMFASFISFSLSLSHTHTPSLPLLLSQDISFFCCVEVTGTREDIIRCLSPHFPTDTGLFPFTLLNTSSLTPHSSLFTLSLLTLSLLTHHSSLLTPHSSLLTHHSSLITPHFLTFLVTNLSFFTHTCTYCSSIEYMHM